MRTVAERTRPPRDARAITGRFGHPSVKPETTVRWTGDHNRSTAQLRYQTDLNRSATVQTHHRWQEALNSSPKAVAQRRMGEMAGESSQAKMLRSLQEGVDNPQETTSEQNREVVQEDQKGTVQRVQEARGERIHGERFASSGVAQRTEKGEKIGKVVGGTAVGAGGAYLGAKVGGLLGSWLGPVGTIGGALVGGYLGARWGSRFGDWLTGPPERSEVTEESVLSKNYFALYVLKNAFGKYFDIKQEAGISRHTKGSTFEKAYRAKNSSEDIGEAVGFTAKSPKRSKREMHILMGDASYDAAVHELVHHNASNEWQKQFGMKGGGPINEAVTQWLTMYALKKFDLKPSGAYAEKIDEMQQLNPGAILRTEVLAAAYFGGSKEAMNEPIGDRNKSLLQMLNYIYFEEWDFETKTKTLEELMAEDSKGSGGKKKDD